jgi:hypothetical protein
MKRKFFILNLIMILVLSLLTVTASAYSFTASMTANSQKVTSATEVTITVKVSNLDVGDNGINMITAYLSYDSDVFETITESNIDPLNDWLVAYASSGKITLQNRSFVNSDEEVMQITLKTKSDLEENTKGKVELTRIVASNSEAEISANPVSTTVTIGSTASTGSDGTLTIIPTNTVDTNTTTLPTTNSSANTTILPTNSITPTNTNTNANTNTNTVSTNSITTNQDTNNTNTATENNIPYTGSDSNALSKVIIGVILIAMVAYIKIRRMEDIK